MRQNIDSQPHFGHQMGRRKASYANHAAQVGEKNGGLPSLRQAARDKRAKELSEREKFGRVSS